MTTVTVPELKRAWQAIQAGQFAEPPNEPAPDWAPDRSPVPVLGTHGQCGASTVALAIATVLAPAHVVECASGPTSGLTGASTKELGTCGDGWIRGARGGVVIDRRPDILLSPVEVPLPAELGDSLDQVIIDVAWEPAHLLAGSCWLSTLILHSKSVVMVALMSVPSLRRLENALSVLPGCDGLAAVLGPPVKKWPKPVIGTAGPLTRHLMDAGRLMTVPVIDSLRLSGLTPDPLPTSVLSTAEQIVRLLDPISLLSSNSGKDS